MKEIIIYCSDIVNLNRTMLDDIHDLRATTIPFKVHMNHKIIVALDTRFIYTTPANIEQAQKGRRNAKIVLEEKHFIVKYLENSLNEKFSEVNR